MVEQLLNGLPWKLVNNNGMSCGQPDQVPVPMETLEAFAHFSYHPTEGSLVVLAIQGMNTTLMDPEMTSGHVDPGEEYFNVGNFGQEGIANLFKWHISATDIVQNTEYFSNCIPSKSFISVFI